MEPKLAQVPEAFTNGTIEGVVLRKLHKFADSRGWLSELVRRDELPDGFYPEMSYVSITAPGVTRGPHEHVKQTDLFCFLGPSNFKLKMWDNRPESSTFRVVSTLFVGEDNPISILIPKGIVHAYQNVGTVGGMVINYPDRLYMGDHKREPVDEIRYENVPNTIFRMDD